MVRCLALIASLLLVAEAGTSEDKPLLIELEPGAQATSLGANGFVVVGTLFRGRAFYWMPSSGVVDIGGTQGVAVSRDGRTIVGNALDGKRLENAAIWLGGNDWRLLGSFHPSPRTFRARRSWPGPWEEVRRRSSTRSSGSSSGEARLDDAERRVVRFLRPVRFLRELRHDVRAAERGPLPVLRDNE